MNRHYWIHRNLRYLLLLPLCLAGAQLQALESPIPLGPDAISTHSDYLDIPDSPYAPDDESLLEEDSWAIPEEDALDNPMEEYP